MISKNFIKIKYISLFLTTCGILMLSLLVGPRVPPDEQKAHCVDNIKIGGPFGISLNCDSSEFMLLANNPELLLEKDNIRQSRPGLIYVAALLVKITKSITPYFDNNSSNTEVTDKKNKTTKSRILKNGSAYGAYVFLNIVILSYSFLLIMEIINKSISRENKINLIERLPTTFIVGIICLFLANDVVKAFAWSPHTQFFNILGPVVSVWCISKVLHGDLEDFTQQQFISFIIGLMILCYGSFFVCGFCLIGALSFKLLNNNTNREYSRGFAHLLILIVLMILPYMAWFSYVFSINGNFFLYESNIHNQVLWISDAIKNRDISFIKVWFEYFVGNIISGFSTAIFSIIVLSPTFYFLLRNRHTYNVIIQLRYELYACVVTILLYLSFFATVGITGPRFAVVYIVPLVIFTSLVFIAALNIINENYKLAYTTFFMFIGTVALVYTVIKNGPWS